MPREAMAGMAVTLQPPVLMTLRENQVQETGPEDAEEEVIQEEAVTNDLVGKADAST